MKASACRPDDKCRRACRDSDSDRVSKCRSVCRCFSKTIPCRFWRTSCPIPGMKLLWIGLTLTFVITAVAADRVTLRDGTVVAGTYLGGSPRVIKLEVGDQIRTLDVSEIDGIRFDAARPQPNDGELPQPASGGAVLPAGTRLVVRMIDGVDSERNSAGQTFAASLDEPVAIGGDTVIPRGTDVVVKLVEDKASGRLTGRTVLTLNLMSIRLNGRMVDVNTETVTEESSSRGSRTAKVAGGAALLGTIIGAAAGGGKGAAIGLGAGAAAGVGAEVLTRGQRVRIPSEMRLTVCAGESGEALIRTPVAR